MLKGTFLFLFVVCRPQTATSATEEDILEVPNHTHATARLQKAKINALEQQMKDLKEILGGNELYSSVPIPLHL